MFIWAAISYQLQEYNIEYGWTWCVCRCNDCLKFGNSWGNPFVQVKLPCLMSNVAKTVSIWETHFFPQSWPKTYPKPKKMSNLLGFAHVFEMETSLFLWHLLWHCLCTPKFYPKYSKIFFCPHPKGWKRANSMCRSWLYIHTYMHTYIHTYVRTYIHTYISTWQNTNIT